MRRQKKKAVSPVIATVLLIAIVIVLALIIFLWARGFIKEAVQKRDKPADQACDEVSLQVRYLKESGELQVTNIGNIPLYRIEIRKKLGGSIEKQSEEAGLPIGQSRIINIGTAYSDVEVVPVILGETETSKKVYTCKNKIAAE